MSATGRQVQTFNHQGHEGSLRKSISWVPSCTFLPFVVPAPLKLFSWRCLGLSGYLRLGASITRDRPPQTLWIRVIFRVGKYKALTTKVAKFTKEIHLMGSFVNLRALRGSRTFQKRGSRRSMVRP